MSVIDSGGGSSSGGGRNSGGGHQGGDGGHRAGGHGEVDTGEVDTGEVDVRVEMVERVGVAMVVMGQDDGSGGGSGNACMLPRE